MATWKRPHLRQPPAAESATEGESQQPLGQELTEANRFTYAALCGISLSQLFPEPEQRVAAVQLSSPFCTEFVTGLVKWLHLSEAVLPTMTAFASGLGGEEADIFAQTLLKDPILKGDPSAITQDLLSFSLKDGRYDARARVLVCHVTSLLQVPMEELDTLEEAFLESLKDTGEEESETAEASRKKKEKRRKWKRYLLIGLATVGGGTVIGVTGGLAAPLVAAGAATIIGSAGAAALGSVAGIAVMTSLFGAAGAGLTGYKMKKRVGAIEEFMFLPLTEGRRLHITIAITGWLGSGRYRTFSAPWTALARSQEQYCLAWEAKYLMELGNALETILSGLANMVAQEALKYTMLSGIVAALTWPASLLSVANVIDNPWGVCLHRSAEVGKHLAHILLSRQQGQRPVTLVGFSLGARVIYFCLQEMAQEQNCQGIIEDVVLLGAPVEGDPKYWEPFRKVVSGRIVNGYCRGDWLLSFVYRTSSVQLRVAGLQPVLLQDRRMENVDLSSVVNGHLDYAKQMDVILKAVGIRTKPGWGEKGLPLAPGSLPQEEPLPIATVSTDETIHQDGQTQEPVPGEDSLKTTIPSSASQAQVPTRLDQSTESLLPTPATPAEETLICSHGVGPNPLGCPDCSHGTQESCAELD
ncbi:transmembrane and coiled-coil domain-containing protein 4 isoform X1 [Meriones unguiculatus]|uniref:transmembrane and coiled-coil domain-containing protein 4 isoform X1 n=1 Tax=Meriones unguiculatus TaxID=10047 RepID=UPI00293E3D0D|nr:transmembrane and coiled-coil domain-containing protein 4 isoform X1 [Meriones unguiculatus]XP_060235172.1 transmembrane and coiled-coil domain-containing protein 4 isoform X1 [Meriones unguiculatus]XP_060235173.1 transmembrane and coiled-coil domain-containing protein 4 isoform X1 [Meriones unguiculatus]XP_060235174.1 transmembrane and coiled-coil domain-containing protein 4 isoform X1 [Meriones unguiculatus]XP_060235175.1 transmembrane and coiled-coil domain-containing protein 4 isoform X1